MTDLMFFSILAVGTILLFWVATIAARQILSQDVELDERVEKSSAHVKETAQASRNEVKPAAESRPESESGPQHAGGSLTKEEITSMIRKEVQEEVRAQVITRSLQLFLSLEKERKTSRPVYVSRLGNLFTQFSDSRLPTYWNQKWTENAPSVTHEFIHSLERKTAESNRGDYE